MNDRPYDAFNIAWLVLLIASCIHVFVDSKRDRRIGSPWMHAFMCAIVAWPLPHILWLFWWPGKLRQAIFGSDELKAKRWAEEELKKYAPNTPSDRTR